MQLRILQQKEDKKDPLFESEDCQTLLRMYEDFYPQIGFQVPWVAYLVIKDNRIVGSCGFTGQPQKGKVEVAYWTFKEFEGQGVSSFACRELIQLVHKADPKLTIIAKTAPEQNASTKILAKNGFIFTEIVQDKDIGDAWLWTLLPPK